MKLIRQQITYSSSRSKRTRLQIISFDNKMWHGK